MSEDVLVYPNADAVATAAAGRLCGHLAELQAAGQVPHVVLTGGSIADALHRAVVSCAGRQQVDWGRVELWWGDERYVAERDPDRNAAQAAAAMLELLPLDPARVHVMPASDGRHGDDVHAAAAAYAEELARALPVDRPDAPLFDVLMLGIGPDGHCASLFPGHPAVGADGLTVGVEDSPKPPPLRISLTLPVLGRAREVWFVAAGQEKADAVRAAYTGAPVEQTPAAGPRGLEHTLWWLDEAVAADLPR